jgi:hypothetical protein
VTMWKNSQRYLEHCLYFDFPVCILLWLKKIGAKTFQFALVLSERTEAVGPSSMLNTGPACLELVTTGLFKKRECYVFLL